MDVTLELSTVAAREPSIAAGPSLGNGTGVRIHTEGPPPTTGLRAATTGIMWCSCVTKKGYGTPSAKLFYRAWALVSSTTVRRLLCASHVTVDTERYPDVSETSSETTEPRRNLDGEAGGSP